MPEELNHNPEGKGVEDLKTPENNENQEKLEQSMKQFNKMFIGADVIERGEGNPGAITVLAEIAKRFPTLNEYYKFASKLGTGSEVWNKFKDECGEDYNKLFEKYGSK